MKLECIEDYSSGGWNSSDERTRWELVKEPSVRLDDVENKTK